MSRIYLTNFDLITDLDQAVAWKLKRNISNQLKSLTNQGRVCESLPGVNILADGLYLFSSSSLFFPLLPSTTCLQLFEIDDVLIVRKSIDEIT